jgi:putative transposase
MIDVIFEAVRSFGRLFHSRRQLVLENLAMRHQLLVLKRSAPKPRLSRLDRLFWVGLRAIWSRWHTVWVIVRPETVIGWHGAGFRLYWRWKSRRREGRPPIDPELIQLIRRMWPANPTWGSPRIRDELAKWGLLASDSTIRKYRPARPHSSSQTQKTFLRNHTKQITAIDFLTFPTATFRVMYVFVVLAQARRKVVHVAITKSPSAFWTGQQFVSAFPLETAPRFLLHDRDGIYGPEFVRRVAGLGMEEKLIAPRSPWQNPYVERLVGSLRRECLDHVLIFNDRKLERVLRDFVEYYHVHRTHRALKHDCPVRRVIEAPEQGRLAELAQVGGLHHRYTRQAA